MDVEDHALHYITLHNSTVQSYVCTYIHTYIHPYIHTSIHTYIHTYTHIPTYVRTYVHTYTHTHIHTYIDRNTYIHTYILKWYSLAFLGDVMIQITSQVKPSQFAAILAYQRRNKGSCAFC